MRTTTKRILSELQRLDRDEVLELPLSQAIYAYPATEEAGSALGCSTGFRVSEDGVWSIPAKELGEQVDCLLVLAVRNLT